MNATPTLYADSDPISLESTPLGGALETSVENSTTPPIRPSHHNARRVKSIMALCEANQGEISYTEEIELRGLAAKLSQCERTTILCRGTETGSGYAIKLTCRSRLCSHCAAKRSNVIKGMLSTHAMRLDEIKFMTFTLKHRREPLTDQLTRLIASFRKMRQRKLWKSNVKGGAWTIEITYNAAHDRWHPHIHVIADSPYIPREKLSATWHAITKDSMIVDIREAHSRSKVVNYLAKYMSKTGDPFALPKHKIAEYALACKGLRMIQTFGSMHGMPTRHKKEPGTERYETICTLQEIQMAAANGDTAAANLAKRWTNATDETNKPTTAPLINATEDWYQGKILDRPPP